MAQNSSTKHLKLLKKIINLSVANSYMTFNPFSTYKVEREPVEIDFLDEEELRKIINFDTPLRRLERAKDMFLFGCFTGLSYIDFKTLAPEVGNYSFLNNGQNCFFTQSCPFHYFLFCICYGMNASIISVGLPSSVNAPRRYLLGLHSGSQ